MNIQLPPAAVPRVPGPQLDGMARSGCIVGRTNPSNVFWPSEPRRTHGRTKGENDIYGKLCNSFMQPFFAIFRKRSQFRKRSDERAIIGDNNKRILALIVR